MRAVCWNGVSEVKVETVPDPTIINRGDAIIRVRATTICGSDLHLFDGYIPAMEKGDIIGHEFMGEVVETGPNVKKIRKGDRVTVSSMISCGGCFHCQRQEFSLCDNTNPKHYNAEKLWGFSPCGIFGYSHLLGGYAGSHAEYIRVPFADIGVKKVPDGLTDEQALFISDAFPTGYMGADLCQIERGDTIAVWGCGAVGLFAIKSAFLLGAERVIAIDRFEYRLRRARLWGAETINYEETDDLLETLKDLTGGQGPDACIDAVGQEAHEKGLIGAYDRAKQAVRLESDRPHVLRHAAMACRKGGQLSVMGVYGGLIDKFPMGAVMNKALTLRTGQMHGQRYQDRLIEHVLTGDIDPAFVATHTMSLEDAQRAFEMFRDKEDDCMRIVFKPGLLSSTVSTPGDTTGK